MKLNETINDNRLKMYIKRSSDGSYLLTLAQQSVFTNESLKSHKGKQMNFDMPLSVLAFDV